MKIDVTTILVLAFLPLAVRTGLYLAACRARSIHMTMMSAIVIAGAPWLVNFFPLPLAEVFRIVLGVFLAIFLFTRYTETELFPDGFVVPLVVEALSALLLNVVLIPMLYR